MDKAYELDEAEVNFGQLTIESDDILGQLQFLMNFANIDKFLFAAGEDSATLECFRVENDSEDLVDIGDFKIEIGDENVSLIEEDVENEEPASILEAEDVKIKIETNYGIVTSGLNSIASAPKSKKSSVKTVAGRKVNAKSRRRMS